MRQIWISKVGPPEALVIKEAADPQPRSGELRIRVEASGVNFADVMGRMGLYPDLPKIPVVPGYEVAGRVDAVGGSVDPSWVGRCGPPEDLRGISAPPSRPDEIRVLGLEPSRKPGSVEPSILFGR